MLGHVEPGWMACPRCGQRVAGRCPACVPENELVRLPEGGGWNAAVWLVVVVVLAVMAWRM